MAASRCLLKRSHYCKFPGEIRSTINANTCAINADVRYVRWHRNLTQNCVSLPNFRPIRLVLSFGYSSIHCRGRKRSFLDFFR